MAWIKGEVVLLTHRLHGKGQANLPRWPGGAGCGCSRNGLWDRPIRYSNRPSRSEHSEEQTLAVWGISQCLWVGLASTESSSIHPFHRPMISVYGNLSAMSLPLCQWHMGKPVAYLQDPNAGAGTKVEDSLWLLDWCEEQFVIECQDEQMMPLLVALLAFGTERWDKRVD